MNKILLKEIANTIGPVVLEIAAASLLQWVQAQDWAKKMGSISTAKKLSKRDLRVFR